MNFLEKIFGGEQPKEAPKSEVDQLAAQFNAQMKEKGIEGGEVLSSEGKDETEKLQGTGTTGTSYTAAGGGKKQ
jgi:hypothetical protein